MKEQLRGLIMDMRDDEKRLREKKGDLVASGQLLATQYYRVKLETLLEETGHSRPSIIEQESDELLMIG
ncbi:hypothetical protein [Alteromonas macleodii]|jgi:hypothetical protein|uniref:hypothetical protein n=1 Tax=Alteromonas macleodii TaxID=28108 RepID=UPI0024A7E011|nr:hypothetical protein [Alteromonas macleodii]|tara:strand:+ start:207 stop:413 length:207 start_codon:yes stop_codon:yes gene_type:complete